MESGSNFLENNSTLKYGLYALKGVAHIVRVKMQLEAEVNNFCKDFDEQIQKISKPTISNLIYSVINR